MQFDLHFALAILPDLLRGALVTAEATLGGMALALVIGLTLAVLGYVAPASIGTAVRAYVQFVRNTPLLVQLYCLFYLLPLSGVVLGAFATGVLGLGLHYGSYLVDVYRGGIDDIPSGQWEAARALGLTRRNAWRHVILPQAIPPLLPILANYLIAMFKESPLLAMITIPEMFGAGLQVMGATYRYNEPLTLIGLIFLGLSYTASLAVGRLEKHVGRR
jgi:polar amino acid transport system permease protein